jgi:peptide/nickel transport system permease protein
MVAAVVRPNIPIIILTLGLLNWMDLSKILRSEVLLLKNMEFIEASRASGTPSGFILRRHILPNVL